MVCTRNDEKNEPSVTLAVFDNTLVDGRGLPYTPLGTYGERALPADPCGKETCILRRLA